MPTSSLDSSGLAEWTWDLSANSMTASPEYYRLLGLSPSVVLKPFHIVPLIHAADRDRVLSSLLRTMAGDKVATSQFRIRRPDGQVRLLLGRATLRTDGQGKQTTVCGSLQDVTHDSHGDRPIGPTDERALHRISVLVVGRDRFSRAGIASILAMNPQIQIVGEASLESAPILNDDVHQLLMLHPHLVVVLDVDTASPEFHTFISQTIEVEPRALILTLVRYEALEAIASLALAGASRLLLSDTSTDQLLRTILEMVGGAKLGTTEQPPDMLFGEHRPGFQGPQQLTATEARVLRLLTHGLRNREIGEELFLSEPTIKRHTQQIYRKLGARDRAHAAALANHFGLAR